MFTRNPKHDELFFSEDPQVLAFGVKLYDAWNEQNGTNFLNALQDIEHLIGADTANNKMGILRRAEAIAYALYLVNQVAHQK